MVNISPIFRFLAFYYTKNRLVSEVIKHNSKKMFNQARWRHSNLIFFKLNNWLICVLVTLRWYTSQNLFYLNVPPFTFCPIYLSVWCYSWTQWNNDSDIVFMLNLLTFRFIYASLYCFQVLVTTITCVMYPTSSLLPKAEWFLSESIFSSKYA